MKQDKKKQKLYSQAYHIHTSEIEGKQKILKEA